MFSDPTERRIYSLILLISLIGIGQSCMGTVPSPGPTTTTAPVEPNACATCTPSQITFIQGTGNPGADGSFPATFREEADDSNGCKQLIAICNGPNVGGLSFMQFNGKGGGPKENTPMRQTVEAPLVCKMGKWLYGDVTVINIVDCRTT